MFENYAVVSIFVLLTGIITCFITYKIVMKKIRDGDVKSDVRIGLEKEIEIWKKTDEYKELQNIKYSKGYEDGKNDSLIKYKDSSEYKSILEYQYSKGFENGKQEALLKYKDSLEHDAILKNEYYKGVKEGVEKALQEYKDSPEFLALKKQEFLMGHKEGIEEAKSKFSREIETWYDFDDGFFKQKFISGYDIRYYYDNRPIGEPSRVIKSQENKFKKENLDLLLRELEKYVEKYINLATPMGQITSVLSSPKPKRIKSNIDA